MNFLENLAQDFFAVFILIMLALWVWAKKNDWSPKELFNNIKKILGVGKE